MKPPRVDDINWDGSGEPTPEWSAAVRPADQRPTQAPNRHHGTNPVPSTRELPDPGTVPLALTTMGDLLAEADELVDYLVEGMIQRGSVNAASAKPKTGKSTTVRYLALAVARGEPFLGRRCQQGTVWYLAFEGRRRDIRNHFRQMGATPDDAIHTFVGQAPKNIVAAVKARAIDEKPDLIIIDTMQRFLKAKSTDDYAEMTLLFDEVIGIAQKSGAALLLVTHNSKADRTGLDAILGSTAIAGSVDTAILLTRTARYRTISTVQRTGDDLDETLIVLDATGRLQLAGSRALADQSFVVEQLLKALDDAGEPLTQPQLFERVEARRTAKLAALKIVVSGNYQVERTGRGTRNDPYYYARTKTDSGSLVPPIGGELENHKSLLNTSSEDSPRDSRSRFPIQGTIIGTSSETTESAPTDEPEHDDGSF